MKAKGVAKDEMSLEMGGRWAEGGLEPDHSCVHSVAGGTDEEESHVPLAMAPSHYGHSPCVMPLKYRDTLFAGEDFPSSSLSLS